MSSTRINKREAIAHLLVRAMDEVAEDAEFREMFLTALNGAIDFGNSIPSLRGKDNGLRLWKAFCAVAAPMKARGDEAWKTFCRSHIVKLEDNEVLVLVALWSQIRDADEILERLMEMSERGEIDEQTLVQECDLVKALHAVQEMNGKVITATRPKMEAWLKERGLA